MHTHSFATGIDELVLFRFHKYQNNEKNNILKKPVKDKQTLQISSPWKPPATRKLSLTASVLICVWENPSNKLPACFYMTNKFKKVKIKYK